LITEYSETHQLEKVEEVFFLKMPKLLQGLPVHIPKGSKPNMLIHAKRDTNANLPAKRHS
jgi:hypothetical protein